MKDLKEIPTIDLKEARKLNSDEIIENGDIL